MAIEIVGGNAPLQVVSIWIEFRLKIRIAYLTIVRIVAKSNPDLSHSPLRMKVFLSFEAASNSPFFASSAGASLLCVGEGRLFCRIDLAILAKQNRGGLTR